MPTGWQRGLLWIPALYLAFMGAFFYGRSLAAEGASLKQDLQEALERQAQAAGRRDAAAVQGIDAEFDGLDVRMRSLNVRLFCVAGGVIAGFVLFAWSTWQVTQAPWSRWETAARWAVLFGPLLSLSGGILGKSAMLSILSKIASITISIGHEHALEKICTWSGHRDLGARIGLIYGWFYRFIAAVVIAGLLGVFRNIPAWMRDNLVEIVLAVGGLFIIALSMTLWTLRTRLLADEAALSADGGNDFEDER